MQFGSINWDLELGLINLESQRIPLLAASPGQSRKIMKIAQTESRLTRVCNEVLSTTGHVTLGKLLNSFEALCPHFAMLW